jgi:hypothetical protein
MRAQGRFVLDATQVLAWATADGAAALGLADVGRIEPGYRAADLLSLVSSAVRNDLDVFVYVQDVLDQLLAGESDDHALRPDVWKESHPEAVRVYRAEERAARADAKGTKRARRRRVSCPSRGASTSCRPSFASASRSPPCQRCHSGRVATQRRGRAAQPSAEAGPRWFLSSGDHAPAGSPG